MRKVSRKGFTLPEVLVTVTIVAVLAAVMVPAVINQVSKGDAPSVGGDVGAIRTAITTFAADTRHFPQRISDMTVTTLQGADKDINGVIFGADSVNYHGPYLPADSGSHQLPTGGVLADTLKLSNSLICIRDDTTNVTPGVSRVSSTVAGALDAAIDGSNGKAAGVVKWTEAVAGVVDAGSLRVCVTSK